ncbi:MAG: hypothetical protein ABIJ75_07235 [Actinomycetota bacterium]
MTTAISKRRTKAAEAATPAPKAPARAKTPKAAPADGIDGVAAKWGAATKAPAAAAPAATVAAAPDGIMAISMVYDGISKNGRHRYVSRTKDGLTVQLYDAPGAPAHKGGIEGAFKLG